MKRTTRFGMRVLLLLAMVAVCGLQADDSSDGYRGILWGSSRESVRKSAGQFYSGDARELDDALIYSGTFQGFDAYFKYMFREDSLVMVAITADFPWPLNDKAKFKANFNKSESASDNVLDRIRGKYGREIQSDKVGTDSYYHWNAGDTDIEVILLRGIQYRLTLSYSWKSYFQRSQVRKDQGFQDEL